MCKLRILSSQIVLSFLTIGLVGCETGPTESAKVNRCVVKSINDAAIRNAVIRKRTLYPYHFEPDGATLNELGMRELDVLAEQYRRSPGTLNVRKADTPQPLYEGRVSTVRDLLARAGVDVASMRFEDGIPGGDGRGADEVIAISRDRNNPSRPLYTESGSSGSSRGLSDLLSNDSGSK